MKTNVYIALSPRAPQRVRGNTPYLPCDGWNLIEERVAYAGGTNAIIRYYWGKDLSGSLQGAGGVGGLLYLTISTSNSQLTTYNSQLFIPCYDNNGNITRYLDANGTTVAQYSYDAFGNLLNKSGPMCDVFRHLFSTKYYDIETELYYYGYRFYCPWLMRWINRDPAGEDLGGHNLYLFVSNNPISKTDTKGLFECASCVDVKGLRVRYKKAWWKYSGWPFGFSDIEFNRRYKTVSAAQTMNMVDNCDEAYFIEVVVEPKSGRRAFVDYNDPGNALDNPCKLMTGRGIAQNFGPSRIEYNYYPIVEFSAGSVKKTQRLWNTYVNMDGNFGINSTATFFRLPICRAFGCDDQN